MKDKHSPKITVITPTYNRAELIVEIIESVINQSFEDFEYLILDDGSTDNTKEVVKPFLKDKRIKYLRHENTGEAETVNWGWSLARGEYFTQVNSDDPILINLFSEMVNALDTQKEYVLAYPDFNIINSDGEILQKVKSPDWNFLQALSNYSCYAASPGVFIRKNAFKKWKKIKRTNFEHINDVEMYWDMALVGNFLHIGKILATWRSHDDAISSSRYKSIPEIHQWYINYFSVKDLSKEVRQCKEKVKKSIDKYCISLIEQSNLENKERFVLEYNNKYRYKYSNLQISDTDLVGNKFNGYDNHLYLRKMQINSKHLVLKKESIDNNTYEISISKKTCESISIMQKKYSLDGVCNPVMNEILVNKWFLNSDTVHMHLMHNGLMDLNLLPIMTKLKPVIWTLHDPWALSGHCIEHFDCKKWKDGCGDCPYLNIPIGINKDKTRLNFEIKKMAIQNSQLDIIVASKYMLDKVKQSPIFQYKNIHLIPFGIDQNIFKQQKKDGAKKQLGISQDDFVIFFRGDTREKKGVDYIEYILSNIESSQAIQIIIVGIGVKCDRKDIKIKEFGWVKNDELMSIIYSASDIFLMPSIVETFGMMAIEAMSCGTLPIVLDGTALPEVVNAPECGVSVKRDKEEYLRIVQYYIDNVKEREERAKKCLKFAQEKYNKDRYVDDLMNVYEKAIANHRVSGEDKKLLEQLKKNMAIDSMLEISKEKSIEPNVRDDKETKKQKENVKNHVELESNKNNNLTNMNNLKYKIAKTFHGILYKISPSFRMQTGAKQRMIKLLHKIDNLENSLNQKIELLEKNINNNLNNKVDNLENSLNQKTEFLENILNQKTIILENNINLSNEKITNLENNIINIDTKLKVSEENIHKKIELSDRQNLLDKYIIKNRISEIKTLIKNETDEEKIKRNKKISIICLIYRSTKFAEAVYESLNKYTPKLKNEEAELLFVANDATDDVLKFLEKKKYNYVIKNNPVLTEKELFSKGYGAPEYINRVYKGYNYGIQNSKGDIIVLINSDNMFSPNWLENLLNKLEKNIVVSSQLVERKHPVFGVFPTAIRGEFGSHPNNYKEEEFLSFAKKISYNKLIPGGAYMPCMSYKTNFKEVGYYPEGNIAGKTFDEIVQYGDVCLYDKLLKNGVLHATACDSLVYHFKEGEKEE